MRADLLGASLEAYANRRPVLNALRLCRRFGRGENVHITKLPQELVTVIEKFIAQDGREKTTDEWVTDFRCLEARCDLVEHYDFLNTRNVTYGVAYYVALSQIDPCRECFYHEEPRVCDRRCKQRAEERINGRHEASDSLVNHHSEIVKKFEGIFQGTRSAASRGNN